MRNNSKRNFISKRPTAFIRVRSVIFSLIKTEEIIRSLSCKNPFCAIVKGLRLFKASEEQIPTAISEETTKRVNCHDNGNLPLFCIEKDTRVGVLYAPFACVLMVERTGFEPVTPTLPVLCAPNCANAPTDACIITGQAQFVNSNFNYWAFFEIRITSANAA